MKVNKKKLQEAKELLEKSSKGFASYHFSNVDRAKKIIDNLLKGE